MTKAKQIMDALGCSRATAYRILQRTRSARPAGDKTTPATATDIRALQSAVRKAALLLLAATE